MISTKKICLALRKVNILSQLRTEESDFPYVSEVEEGWYKYASDCFEVLNVINPEV